MEEVGHHGRPHVPAVVNAAERAVVADGNERFVELIEQLRIALTHRDAVQDLADRLADELKIGVEAGVEDRDRGIHQHSVETVVRHILIGVDLVVVGADLVHARFDKLEKRVGLLQRADSLADAVFKRVDPGGIALLDDELQKRLIVGKRKIDFFLVLGRDLQTRKGDVVQSQVEPGDEVVPAVVDKLRRHSHPFGQRVHDVDLKTDQVLVFAVRLHEHVGDIALGVAAPFEDRLVFGRRGKSADKQRDDRAEKKTNPFHQAITPLR